MARVRMAEFSKERKLDQFQTRFLKRMNEFREQNLHCDVTLNVDGTLFPCHSLVLTTASPYFETMFNGNFKESSSNIISMKEVQPEAMEQILNTLYTVRIQLHPENVYFVLTASHLFQLEEIVDACVECIVKNHDIHYLIETCIFAKRISRQNLYDACIQQIAQYLVHWAKTDSFEELPFEDFNLILKNPKLIPCKDTVSLLIVKWCSSKNANADTRRIEELLKSAKLWDQTIGATFITQSIVNGENELVKAFNKTIDDNENHTNANLCFNLYVNTIDVKSGARGWGVLKTNDSFDKYSTLSNYNSTNNTIEAVCKLGTRTYFLEKDYITSKCTFFCYDAGNNRIPLKTPKVRVKDSQVSLVAMENTLYLVHSSSKSARLWAYKCDVDEWIKPFAQDYDHEHYWEWYDLDVDDKKEALHCYSSCTALITLDNILYVIGTYEKSGCNSILSFDIEYPSERQVIYYPNECYTFGSYAACSFDGKIAILACDPDDDFDDDDDDDREMFCIYNVKTDRFLDNIAQMKTNPKKSQLIHRGGFIYAVSNSLLEKDEKYDINANTWTEIPHSLPKRVKTIDDAATVATGSVFAVDANC